MKLNVPAFSLVLVSTLACASCSMVLDDNSVVYSAAPGKYDYLDCKGIAERTDANDKRTAELSSLIQRANQDPVGPLVSNMIYRDELNAKQADTMALRQVADDKRCAPNLAKKPQASLEPMH